MSEQKKIRLRLTLTYITEYDADPVHYGTTDPLKIATIDRDNALDDPQLIISHNPDSVDVKVEVV